MPDTHSTLTLDSHQFAIDGKSLIVASTLMQISENHEIAQTVVGLVIPAYAEAAVLPDLLQELARCFGEGYDGLAKLRVLVVDDGSPTMQAEAMLKAVANMPASGVKWDYMALPKNCGKGKAVRTGWEKLAGSCDLLAFLDADSAVSAAEFSRCLEVALDNPDVTVFASRVKMRGRRVERSFKRHLSGRIFATLVGSMIDNAVYDSQCGCKILPSTAFLRIKEMLVEDGFVFDVELLAALNALDEPVVEVPVDWIDKPDSKVRLMRDSLRMFAGLWRIRSGMKNLDNVQKT